MVNINIIKENYVWNGTLQNRNSTKFLVLHHEAGWGNAQNIHNQHIRNGWVGIGYHFYVRQDGTVYEGRPINTIGSHTENYNSVSIGICAEGYYHPSTNSNIKPDTSMPEEQFNSLVETIIYCLNLFPDVQIVGHRDLNATACPGNYFPFNEILLKVKDILEGEENVVKYERLKDIPNEWGFRDIINTLMNAKIILGDGSDQSGNNDIIDLSHEQVRTLIFLYRGGAFDRKLIKEGFSPVVEV